MGERRSGRGRFRLGRRRAADDGAAAAAPCVPCGQQGGLRPFTLNTDDIVLDDDLVPVLVDGVSHAITDGQVVLFDPHRATSTLLNSSAALVWASVDGVATVSSIVDDLAAETGADRATIDTDVRDTIARFVHGGIVELPADAAADPHATGHNGSDHNGTSAELAEGDDRDGPGDGPGDEPGDGPSDERGRRRARRVEAVLARRPWCFADVRRCAGAPVAIRTDSDELAALLAPSLARLGLADEPARTTVSIIERPASSRRRFRILRDTATHAFAATAAEAFDSAFSLLNDIAINDSPGRLVLHAGAVERDGSIVVVAGPSGRGKSTLTAALVQRGFGYLTDEVVAIDPDTWGVLAYPKPLDLDRHSAELLAIDAARDDSAKGKIAIEQIGAVAPGAGRLRLLVLLADPATPTPTPAPTSPAEHLVALLANTFASTFEPATGPPEALQALSTLTQQVPIIHLDRTSVADACRAIDEQLRTIDLARTS